MAGIFVFLPSYHTTREARKGGRKMAQEIRWVVREIFRCPQPEQRREMLRARMEEYARLLQAQGAYAKQEEKEP